MKKSCLFVLLSLLVTPLFAEHVDPETARKVATTFLSNNGVRTSQLTDLSKEAGFTNLYIFNGNPGFVVMSADDCVQPILGYSLEGNFVAENMPTNISGWLQGYNNEIQYGIDCQLRATSETAKMWKDLMEGDSKAGKATVVVGPLVQTQWDQDPYYNQLCPIDNTANAQAVTGCVATAMAQVMKYWNHPSRGIGSHSYTPSNRPEFGVQFADFGATDYDWTHMPNKLTASSSSTQKTAVATLMYHCGVAVEMMYDIAANDGSGAYSSDIPYALYNYFGYQMSDYREKSSYNDSQWTNMLKTELDNSRPVQYNGSGTAGGHAFVCDGYNTSNKYHFNWGWSGQNDGYFSLSSLVPGSGGVGGGGYNFTSNQSACFGIQPSACTLAAPTDLDYTLEGTNTVKLTWSSVSGASSFNVYRNSTLIGNTSATTYYDYSAPYGTNEYYVRCVDANGQLSLASNRVNAFIAFPTPNINDLALTFSNDNAALSWTTPSWCYPETPTATLTYGDGSFSGYSVGYGSTSSHMYWGHRYPSNTLGSYNNLAIYKVSFYTTDTGNFGVYVYKGTTSNHPQTLVYSQTASASAAGWIDIDMTEIQLLDTSKDLWVFIYDTDGHEYPAAYSDYSGSDGNYCTSDPLSEVETFSDAAFLIRTYLTDGVYTYKLYQDGVVVSDNLSETNYDVTLGNDAPNLFHVTTHYYGGEAESNKVGHAKGNASVDDLDLGANDMMTLTSGSTLTVTGTLKNSDPTRLILEDGAQLIHNTTGVKATMKKNIEPYTTDDNGWKFIAVPVTEGMVPSTENGLLNGSYDLYYYDEPTHYWMNYRNNAFSLAPKQAYLYATNASNNSLQFAGTLTPSNTPVASNTLSWSAENLKGFNLIGNPFACNASLSSDFYVISGNHVVVAKTKRTIAPCEGVLVQATAANQTVTFSRADTQKGEDNALIDLVVTDGKTVLDRIRVRQGEGPGMEKFRLDGTETASLSLSRDKQDYAVVHMNGQASWPVQFKTVKNGVYTLRVESNSLNPEYLHLIDHLTGADIDLLLNPSYSFEAQTDDYASRFKLVFDPNGETGEIGDGFVEGKSVVIDMTGRVVATKANTQLAPGVYILRTVDGNETHSQKIIIK